MLNNDVTTNQPIFTVIVLCYQNTDLLYGMLSTIFSQDYPCIELIVSDDASEDFEPEMVKQYIIDNKGDNIKRLIVRKNTENQGTVRHIHDVLELVEGEFLIFTAADDRFACQDALSRYMEGYLNNPDAKWIVARCNMVSPDYMRIRFMLPSEKDEPYFMAKDPIRLFSRWSRRGMAIPCCMSFRRSAIYLVGGIDLDYKYLEDWPLELKLLRNGYAPYYLPRVVALHSTGGISNSNVIYGKEIKRQFYQDKELVFQKEVDPYRDMLTQEDILAHNIYMREIMDRSYFLDIDWPDTKLPKRIRLIIEKPIRLWWVFEKVYMGKGWKVKRKKTLLQAVMLLLAGMRILHSQGYTNHEEFWNVYGILLYCISILLIIIAFGSYPIERFMLKKQRMRTELVN